jgi:aspartate aminotransferase
MPEPPFDPFRYAHAHQHEVAWMCQNTNHLVPPEHTRAAVAAALEERVYEGYPYAPGDPELKRLVLADIAPGTESACLVTGGGTEALYMLTRALLTPGDEVIASDPSYLIIHRFIELSGGRILPLPIYQTPYRLGADRIQSAVSPRTKMILLIDPLNPLGSGYPAEEVRAIAEIAHDRGIYLLNDVTYRDFSEQHTLAHPFAPEQTLTVWSVSKNCGLAGLRLGGLIARPELAQQVQKYNTNDLGVNVLAQRAAVATLSTKSQWFPAVKATTRANQEKIRAAVQSVSGTFLPVFPSQANMFVIDVSETGLTPEAIQREMLERHGVFVRAGNYLSPSFGSRFVRVSFSNPPEDVSRFVSAFPAAVSDLKARSPSVSTPAVGASAG